MKPKTLKISIPQDVPRTFSLGEAVCDLAACKIHVEGETHRLEPKLVGVLDLLIKKDGDTVSRDELLESVWDDGASDEALNQVISRLRRMIGDAEAIVTIPRVGYRLAVSAIPTRFVETNQSSGRFIGVEKLIAFSNVRMLLVVMISGILMALVGYELANRQDIELEFNSMSEGDVEFFPQGESK